MARFVPRQEVFNNTLSPLVSRGRGLSFETLKNVATSFRKFRSKEFRDCWLSIAQDILLWPIDCSKIFLTYFEMFNQGIGDRAFDETGTICRFLVYLYCQMYSQGDLNRDNQRSMAQERAFSSPDEKTPPTSPRRIVNTNVLLSPRTARNTAVALDEQNEKEQIAFLNQHFANIFAVLQEYVVLEKNNSKHYFCALEIVLDCDGELVVDALKNAFDKSSCKQVSGLMELILRNMTQSESKSNLSNLKKTHQMYGIHRSTRVHVLEVPIGEATISLADLKISNCNNTTIYMLQPFRFCHISSCADCTIVVGAVSSLVSVENCEGVKVVVCSRYVRINNCLDCTIFTYTTNRPLLLGDNRGLLFGPYNTNYGTLQQHLQCAKLQENIGSSSSGYWDSPWDLNTLEDASSAFSLMQPRFFFPFSVPIKDETELTQSGGTLAGIPLPTKYSEAIKQKISSVNLVRETIKSIPKNKGSDEIRSGRDSKVEEVVQKKFRDWLVNSGNVREIADLICLEKACKVE